MCPLTAVYRHIVDAQFPVQMGAAGEAGVAAGGHRLSGGHRIADIDEKLRQMEVGRHDAQTMIDDQNVAVQIHRVGENDRAVGRGQNRRANAAAQIDAGVENLERAAVVGAGVAIGGGDDGVGDRQSGTALPTAGFR